MPASTALFRDMTAIRFEHPEWIPENCTACGKCYTVCPDTAIPGLVSEVGAVLRHGGERRAASTATSCGTCPRRCAPSSATSASSSTTARETDPVGDLLEEAIDKTLAATRARGRRSAKRLGKEMEIFREELDGFRFALSRPYYTVPEKREPGSGGLLSITVNPYTCKGCMECVAGLRGRRAAAACAQTDDSVKKLRRAVGLLARPAQHAEEVRPHRRPRAGHRGARDAAARQGQLPRLHERRRRLPGLLGEDRHPPVHGDRRGADAAARRQARRRARRADRDSSRSTSS